MVQANAEVCARKKGRGTGKLSIKKKKNVSENCASQRLRDGKKGRIQLFFFSSLR